MIVIAAVDDSNGMMFNKRRQSQDRILRQRILDMTAGKKLWMNHYTKKQFSDMDAWQINVDENFLNEATDGEFCFVESVPVSPFEKWIEKIVLFRWNRKYPGDFSFDIDLTKGWSLVTTEDFPGSSHEKITMEVYVR